MGRLNQHKIGGLKDDDRCRTNPPDVKGTPRGVRLATG